MTKRENFVRSPSYDVGDEELSRRIDELMEQLEPYPNLDLIREVLVTGVKLAQENCLRGDLKILRATVKELRYAFKVFSQYRDFPKVTIFGSARSVSTDSEYQTAVRLGKKLARAGYMVITGAGGGIMGAANEGAGRASSFGLNILLPFEQTPNETITGDPKLINFRYFFTRKLFFVKESDGIVVMPGGFGTQDEGFEALTLMQTGRSSPIPIVMLDGPGGSYWSGWNEFVRGRLFERGFVSPEDDTLFVITDDVDQACEEIHTFYRRYHSSRYVDHSRRLVLRLKEPLKEEWIRQLNEEFQDILFEGRIEACGAFPEESDEPGLLERPRLSLHFNRRSFPRLRQLINAINRF